MSEFWPDQAGQPPAILTEVRDKVGIVTLNRPASLNAWTPAMGTLYFNTLEQLAVDPKVNVILVHGAGRGFCAGADMKGLDNIAASGGQTPDRDHRQYWYPLSIGKPIIAAIHGPCYGVGFQQALCADLRFVARDARLSAPYAKRGLIAEIGTSWLLSRLIGTSHALDVLLSARVIDGEEAVAMRLANRVFEADVLFEKAFEYCAAMAAETSPWSLRTIKQQVYHDLMTTLQPAFDRSEAFLAQSLKGADFVEGIAAFREKRGAEFPPLPPHLGKLDPWPGE
jgi:enoyl-CoA hydratase/carnithine racemase